MTFNPNICRAVVLSIIGLSVIVTPLRAASTQKGVAPAAPVTGTSKRLREVEQQLKEGEKKTKVLREQAAVLDKEMQELRYQMVAAAQRIQSHEGMIADLKTRLSVLISAENEKSTLLDHRRGQLANVIVALQRVSRNPPEALITRPISPGDTVRSAILLRSVVPEIELRAVSLRTDLREIVSARNEIERRRKALAKVTDNLLLERKSLKAMIGQKSRMRRRTIAKSNAAQRQLKQLAREASSLRDLMSKIEMLRKQRIAQEKVRLEKLAKENARKLTALEKLRKNREKAGEKDAIASIKPTEVATIVPPSAPGFTSKNRLPLPVVGKVIARYGQAGTGGMTHKGVTIETGATAQVVAPRSGRVVFADIFRGYGLLLIIEHRGGYHSLMSGLSRIDSTVGQSLLAGEPVGVMGNDPSQKPRLYVELRKNSQPVNPLPWLAARENKVNG